MPVKTLSSYNQWKPVKHSVFKDELLANEIHEKGYAIRPFLNQAQLNQILDLYKSEHQLTIEEGGMFYSLYSKDLAYRQRVHQAMSEILYPLLATHFKNYKNIVNTFITKASGPKSEFYVHQDTTALDEYKHSPLSVWIPLQDITPENGALGVIEKTHWFFSPYRGISFASPFQKINVTVREYLKPLYMKAGEAIIFDPRIVHHSMPNTSGADRLVALCGVFPQDAEFVMCYKDPAVGSKIELLKQEDSFILENESFFYNCHSRPTKGICIKKVDDDFPAMDAKTFEELCVLNGIEKKFALGDAPDSNCKFVAEPDGINRFDEVLEKSEPTNQIQDKSVWQKIKAVFS